MRTTSLARRLSSLAFLIAASFFSYSMAAQTETVLHVFQGAPNDGIEPAGGVVFDAQGNLYGATTYGGNGGVLCIGGSCGTVYQLIPPAKQGRAWTENILYNFTGVTHQDGQLPSGGPIIDAGGNLYGVTAYGGTGGCVVVGGLAGCGTVYEVAPPSAPGGEWTKTTIYSFQGGADGYLPIGNLTFDSAGNLYGATSYGGGFGSCNAPFYQNCGTVFELNPPKVKDGVWTERVLYAFKGYAGDVSADGGGDGANPNGGLVIDRKGNIYGTTAIGGFLGGCVAAIGKGCGTLFELRRSSSQGVWIETILHRFTNYPDDGAGPLGGVVADAKGNLYGSTEGGGAHQLGAIFLVTAPASPDEAWSESVLFSMGLPPGGDTPMAGFTLKDGSLFGAMSGGGDYFAGTILRFETGSDASMPTYTVLTDFPTGNQAAQPESVLTFDKGGTLYGTTLSYNHQTSGAVFSITNP